MVYISNAFSCQMVSSAAGIRPITKEQARDLLACGGRGGCDAWECAAQAGFKSYCMRAKSVVGHADTAALLAKELELNIECNRETVHLKEGDTLVVGQYVGPRLPEGATALPEGAKIEWYKVEVGYAVL